MRLSVPAAVAALLAIAGCSSVPAPPAGPAFTLIEGSTPPGRGPDGNSVFLDAPDGLVLVDTGRHPDHRDKLLAYARERGRPIAAIVNTHWHFDHTTGNGEILAAYPGAEVVASTAIDGALYRGFAAGSRKGAEDFLKSGQATPAQRAEIERGFAAMDNLAPMRSARPVLASGPRRIAGRTFDVRLAPYAVSEGDVWLIDPRADLAIVGDLVVGVVPFMDTACVDGWQAALAEVAAARWTTLIPGHGKPMDRPAFDRWRAAFDGFVACGRSDRPAAECSAGWVRDAAEFIDDGDERRIQGMANYYLASRLRSAPAEQRRFCRPQ